MQKFFSIIFSNDNEIRERMKPKISINVLKHNKKAVIAHVLILLEAKYE